MHCCSARIIYVISFFVFFNDTATTEIYTYYTLFPYTTLFRSGRQRRQRPVAARHGRAGQPQLVSEPDHLVEPLLGAALLILAIAVERHGAARRLVRAMPLAVMLHEELLVEQPPEQRHRLAGELGLDLVGSALNRDGRVARHGAPLGLPSARAETLPFTPRTHATAVHTPHPALDPRLWLRTRVASFFVGLPIGTA